MFLKPERGGGREREQMKRERCGEGRCSLPEGETLLTLNRALIERFEKG